MEFVKRPSVSVPSLIWRAGCPPRNFAQEVGNPGLTLRGARLIIFLIHTPHDHNIVGIQETCRFHFQYRDASPHPCLRLFCWFVGVRGYFPIQLSVSRSSSIRSAFRIALFQWCSGIGFLPARIAFSRCERVASGR